MIHERSLYKNSCRDLFYTFKESAAAATAKEDVTVHSSPCIVKAGPLN